MAKEDPKPAREEVTRATATPTVASSEPATRTEPQAPPKAPSPPQAPSEPPDPMVAWLEERIATEQYSSPAWQAMTSALLFYRGLKANG